DYGRFKLFTRLGYAHNQWAPYNKVPFSPAVNTGYIAGRSRVGLRVMHPWQLQNIVSLGGEIVSHGRYHAYLDFMSLAEAVQAGATQIRLNISGTGYGWNACVVGYTYTIEEGSLVETVEVAEIGRDEYGAYVNLTAPLANSYTDAAKMHITE